MSDLVVTNIDELDAALVQQSQEEFTAMLQDKYPELDLRRGVIHDVVAFLGGGVAAAVAQTEVNRVLQSRSLLAIQENPTLADPELVDHVLSNVGVSRKVGTRAVGEITIVVTGGETVVIAANAKYVATGLIFRTDVAIVARPVGTTISTTTERVLTPRGDGSYSFTVPATAESVGDEYNIRANTTLTPDPTQTRFVTAFANGDFTGGTATESNADLITRMAESLPAAVSGGRANIVSLIKSQAVFGDTQHYSITGFGDVEMLRDQRSIFPVSMGGCIDVYAQTSAYPQTVTATIECTLQQKLATSSIWAFSVTRDIAPGFYEVSSIRNLADPVDFAGLRITSDVRGVDLSGDGWRPDILTVLEGTFTRWQTATIKFEDNATDTTDMTVGDKRDYIVNLLVSPLILELQDFLGSDTVRPLSADVLVRAVIPCILTINATILRSEDESAPDLDAIRIALRNYVSRLDFPGALYASQLVDTIYDSLSGNHVVSSLVMQGKILKPDGTSLILRDTTVITIPNAPSVYVTPRTTAFFLDITNIGLTVKVRG
jgi:hypothetical protein